MSLIIYKFILYERTISLMLVMQMHMVSLHPIVEYDIIQKSTLQMHLERQKYFIICDIQNYVMWSSGPSQC